MWSFYKGLILVMFIGMTKIRTIRTRMEEYYQRVRLDETPIYITAAGTMYVHI